MTLVGILGCALLTSTAAAKAKSHPDITLKDLSGTKHSIADYRGKVLVVNFWATWCGPCREELPMLSAIEKQYGPQGVVFVEASLDEKKDWPRIPAFLAKAGVDFPVWVGANPETLHKLGLGKIIPATLILGRDGDIVSRLLGEARHDEVTARLDWILSGESGEPPAPVVTHY
jgi:thiol-disulfide isomerase/thioredoxin